MTIRSGLGVSFAVFKVVAIFLNARPLVFQEYSKLDRGSGRYDPLCIAVADFDTGLKPWAKSLTTHKSL
jgi:hypothetical protein